MVPPFSSPSPSALHALDEIEKPPAFVLAQGPCLHEADHVAHLAFVLLVVDFEPVPTAIVLAVGLVLHQSLDRDDDRLLHRVAHDLAGHHLPLTAARRFVLRHALTSPEPGSLRMPFRCSVQMVRSRAMSRSFSRIETGFWSWRIELRNRRLKISSVRSLIFPKISSSFMSRIFPAFKSRMLPPRQIVPLNELRLDRQLARAQLHRLPRELVADPLQLKQDAARLHHRDPKLGRALAFSHSRLRRLHRHRLIRKNPDPHLAAALDEARDRHTGRLDLAVGDPRRLEGLEPELAEGDRRARVGFPFSAPAHLLPMLDALWYEHARLLLRGPAVRHGGGFRSLALRQDLAFEDPDFHAHRPVDRPGGRAREIDVGAERVERHASVAVALGAGHFGAAQPPRADDAYPAGAGPHGRCDRLLHRAADRDALLQLARNVLADQRRVHIGLLHLVDVEEDLLLRDVLELVPELVDLLTAPADHQSRPRGRDVDGDLRASPLDHD